MQARAARPIRALVFDFDGLIVDTESTAFQAWSELYSAHGCNLSLEQWVNCVGSDHSRFDPCTELSRQLGLPLDAAELHARTDLRHRSLAAVLEPRPGVREALGRARELGLAIAMASSSSRRWLDDHLGRLGLAGHFSTIASRDDVARVKPDPELYLCAARRLGIPPEQALAIEDSLHGIRAAKGAGMRCIAVPNPVTAGLPLHEADRVLGSLADVPLDAILAGLDAGEEYGKEDG